MDRQGGLTLRSFLGLRLWLFILFFLGAAPAFFLLIFRKSVVEAAIVYLLLFAVGYVFSERFIVRKVVAWMDKRTRENELILSSVGEGIFGVDTDGNVTFVNPAAAKMIGREPAEMIGKYMHALIHHTRADGTPYPGEDCPNYGAFKDGLVHRVTDEVYWRKDGTGFPVRYMSTPIRDSGRLVGAVVVFEDVTEQKKLEEQLFHAQKMEAVGRLAGGVAHDFNNFLTEIMGYAELAAEALPPDSPIRGDLEEIEKTGERAGHLTHRLLAFSRRQKVEPRVINLNELMPDMQKMLKPLIGETVELIIRTAPGLGRVKVDPGQIEQVVMN